MNIFYFTVFSLCVSESSYGSVPALSATRYMLYCTSVKPVQPGATFLSPYSSNQLSSAHPMCQSLISTLFKLPFKIIQVLSNWQSFFELCIWIIKFVSLWYSVNYNEKKIIFIDRLTDIKTNSFLSNMYRVCSQLYSLMWKIKNPCQSTNLTCSWKVSWLSSHAVFLCFCPPDICINS